MNADVKALIARLQEAMDAYDSDTLGDDPHEFDSWKLLCDVKDALEAAQQTPAVDREALENALGVALANAYDDDSVVTVEDSVAGQLLASGILQDVAEVEARGLEKAAEAAFKVTANMHGGFSNWLNRRAQQVREGKK